MRKVLGGIVIGILVIVLIAATALFVITNTDYGHSKVRDLALGAVRSRVHGLVRLGEVSGNLLSGITLHDLVITDSAGRPFVSVETARVRYSLGDLLHKRIHLTHVELVQPAIVLSKRPGEHWNYRRIFPKDTTPHTHVPGFGSWITIDDAHLVSGHVVVRTPWAPKDTATAAARDSLIRVALSGQSRTRVERVPGGDGFQRVMDFSEVTGTLPHLRLADPDSDVMVVQVATLQMIAAPFRPPVARVRDVAGTFRIGKDSLWFRDVDAALSASKILASGAMQLDSNVVALDLQGDTVSLADLRWLYPRLPADGGGSLHFAMYSGEHVTDFTASKANVRVGASTASGSFGMRMGDTLRFHDTDLTVAALDTRLIEQLVPGLDLPRRGTVSGHAAVSGPLQALRVNGDVAFDDQRSGRSRVIASGGVGFGSGIGFRADELRLRFAPLQVELAKIVRPSLPLGGTLTGTATVDGSTLGRMVATLDVEHRDGRAVSRLTGNGAAERSGRDGLEIDVRAHPLSLREAGRFAPSLGLHGDVTGPITLRGSLKRLLVSSDLQLPQGGELETRGQLDLASAEKGYDLTVAARVVNLRRVLRSAPRSSITALATARGRGFDPATMQATLAADLSRSQIDSLALDSVHLRLRVADGVLQMDSLAARTPFARAHVNGAVGLVANRTGTLTYVVEIDSLSGLRRWLPGGDTGVVQPRPGRIARQLARARRDSARVARAAEVERMATGRSKAVAIAVKPVPGLRADSLAGTIYTAGTLRGSIKDFTLEGRAAVRDIVARGSSVRKGRMEFAWSNARTPRSIIALGASLDTVQAAGLALDSVEARVSYAAADRSGRAEIAVRQDTGIYYSARADYRLSLDDNQLRLASATLRFDTTVWRSPHPGTIHWGKGGVQIGALELLSGKSGRIYVNGTLPTSGAANVDLVVEGVEVENLVALLQGDLTATGRLSMAAHVEGTSQSPRIHGAAGLVAASYRGTPIPDVRASFDYANARLVTEAQVQRRPGRTLATASGSLPINLAFSGVTGSRFPDGPLTFDIHSDSLPLDALPRFTDAVSDIHGRLIGIVAVRGTLKHPRATGALSLDLGSARVVASGTQLSDVVGYVRLHDDLVVIDSIVGFARGGRVAVAGALGIEDISKPSFALRLKAEHALVLDNEQGRVTADADIAMTGPFDSVTVRGRATVLNGVIYIPEPQSKQVLSASDPAVFAVIDTSVAGNQQLVQTASALMRNLTVNVALRINRDTWARSADGNIEVYTPSDAGPLRIRVDRRHSAIVVQGSLATERGDYVVATRRFTITRGSVTFIPDADQLKNPLLQITGEHDVELPGRGALAITVIIGGTAQHPTISLSSNSQPPISETDLLSYLAFGRSSSSLLQQSGSSLSGQSTASGALGGTVAALATRQLTSVALGTVVHQLTEQAGRQLGTDELNVQPADVPPELSTNTLRSLLQGTQIEAGKYINPSTFVALQGRVSTDAVPGVRVEKRLPGGFQIQASFEPRYLIREPSLSTPASVSPTGVFGLFVIREIRF